MPYAPPPPKSGCRLPPPSSPIWLRYAALLASTGAVEMSVFQGLSDGNTVHEPSGPFGTPVRAGSGPGVGDGPGPHAAAATPTTTSATTQRLRVLRIINEYRRDGTGF